MPLIFTKPEPVTLKGHGEFTEKWVQQRIIDDPSLLGLGDVELVAAEKIQPKAGRLDLLLHDDQLNRRYEVELMLGATDPSHIMRTIEYWDIERRRYPAYDHVGVLVAEDIYIALSEPDIATCRHDPADRDPDAGPPGGRQDRPPLRPRPRPDGTADG